MVVLAAASAPALAKRLGSDITVPLVSSDSRSAEEAWADYQRAIRELERAKAEARGDIPVQTGKRARGGAGSGLGSRVLDTINTPIGLAILFAVFGVSVALVVHRMRSR